MVVFAESGILLVDQGEQQPEYYGKRTENPIPYFHAHTARGAPCWAPFPEQRLFCGLSCSHLVLGGALAVLGISIVISSPCMDP